MCNEDSADQMEESEYKQEEKARNKKWKEGLDLLVHVMNEN